MKMREGDCLSAPQFSMDGLYDCVVGVLSKDRGVPSGKKKHIMYIHTHNMPLPRERTKCTFLARSSNFTVRFPVPGPTSNTCCIHFWGAGRGAS